MQMSQMHYLPLAPGFFAILVGFFFIVLIAPREYRPRCRRRRIVAKVSCTAGPAKSDGNFGESCIARRRRSLLDAVADRGYCSSEEICACEEAGSPSRCQSR